MAPPHLLLLNHHSHLSTQTLSSLHSGRRIFLQPRPSPTKPDLHLPPCPSTTVRFATESDSEAPPTPSQTEPPAVEETSDSFESRLSSVRLKYRSGTGKKAEIRKSRKSGGLKSGSASNNSVFLPPIPLKEPVSGSAGGRKVEFGFTPYSEVVNGRIAGLGLAALLAVELATGKGVLNFHTPSIVFVQVYFVAAVSAVYLKYEKEKISVWPQAAAESKQSTTN